MAAAALLMVAACASDNDSSPDVSRGTEPTPAIIGDGGVTSTELAGLPSSTSDEAASGAAVVAVLTDATHLSLVDGEGEELGTAELPAASDQARFVAATGLTIVVELGDEGVALVDIQTGSVAAVAAAQGNVVHIADAIFGSFDPIGGAVLFNADQRTSTEVAAEALTASNVLTSPTSDLLAIDDWQSGETVIVDISGDVPTVTATVRGRALGVDDDSIAVMTAEGRSVDADRPTEFMEVTSFAPDGSVIASSQWLSDDGSPAPKAFAWTADAALLALDSDGAFGRWSPESEPERTGHEWSQPVAVPCPPWSQSQMGQL